MKYLNEGLIVTHDIHQSKKILEDFLSKTFFYDLEIKENKINLILSNGKFTIDIFSQFLNLLNNLGYYISIMEIMNNQNMKNTIKLNIFKEKYLNNDFLKNIIKYEIVLEPKFDIIHKLKSNILYHVTELKYLDRIKRNGLIPKSKNTKTYYPERLYFVYNIEDAQMYIKSKNFYYLTSIDDFIKQPNKSKFKEVKFEILEIELPIDNDIIFYDDPNFKGKGIYTYDNVSKEYIK